MGIDNSSNNNVPVIITPGHSGKNNTIEKQINQQE